MKRIEALRTAALQEKINRDDFFYHFYSRYSGDTENPDLASYADAFYYALENLTPRISDDELIVGKNNPALTEEQRSDFHSKYNPVAMSVNSMAGGQHSHMAIDYELVLASGINGIIAQIDHYAATADGEKRKYYACCRRCLEAVIKYSENYAARARRLAETETDKNRRNELLKLAEICERVPANPAETFYEAVQSVHFVTHCISLNPFRIGYQQYQLGHPDRYLYPYYKHDIERGAITKEYAQLLLDCLGVQINNRVPNGLSSGYMVGGRYSDGTIVQNELTEMCMQVIDDIRLVYPAVGLCYTAGMDERYLEKACEILSHGRSHPAIFNDDIITKGLMCYGVPEKEARNYIHSTCVEITPVASSNVWVASPYTNLPQLLLDLMDGEYNDFDELINALFSHLDERIKTNFERENEQRKRRAEYSLFPLLSCFVNDCLSRGTDIEHGGARYNWIMPSFVGAANLVDSLYAIKTVVFDEKQFTLGELKAILDSNFENSEALRQRLLRALPKYGNDTDSVDGLFGLITEHIIAECRKYNGVHSNSRLIPSVFCWIMHEQFGTETGATPDGRLAGFPLGDGSGPCQGREMCGPTASIISSTKWAHHELIGGVAVNMKFSKSSLGANSVTTMKNLVKTYLERGGFEMQINVIDKKTLEDAAKNPEAYRDLVVRIGGYSDYFVKLSDAMQKEIILRTEHEI